jgi:hypothetical protein
MTIKEYRPAVTLDEGPQLNSCFIVLAILLCAPVSTAAAETPTVTITSPAAGTVVHPGESIVVTVQATPREFESVGLQHACSGANSEPPAIADPPYQFVLVIPASSDMESGRCGLMAPGWPRSSAGIVNSLEKIAKDVVDLDIERAESPLRLHSEPLTGAFHHVGETRWLQTTGVFADGSSVKLTRSTRTKYETSAPSVATVNDVGIVTAVGSGSANITVRNGHAIVVVPVAVPKE